MIIKLHFPFEAGTFWTDEAIESLIGQKTKVAGCPAKVLNASRCLDDDDAMDLRIEVDNAFKSYIRSKCLYQMEDLLDSISFEGG